jgi:hypothetical protein
MRLFALLASLVAFALAPTATAAQCAEAARFGVLEVVPSTLAQGDVRPFFLPLRLVSDGCS